MLKHISHGVLGRGTFGWIESHYHFSFAHYLNPDNVRFGVLQVLNDSIIAPNHGFADISHENMELLTYVVSGQLTHENDMGDSVVVNPGDMQHISAGSGILTSEYNKIDEPLHVIQIWIEPDKKGGEPTYGDFKFNWEDRVGKWMPMVGDDAPIKINADLKVSTLMLHDGDSLDYLVGKDRQAYLLIIEGQSHIGKHLMNTKDGLEIKDENITVKAVGDMHCIILDMALDENEYTNNMELIDKTKERYDKFMKRIDKAKVEPKIK